MKRVLNLVKYITNCTKKGQDKVKGMRQKVEFYCSSCGKYFDIKMNMSLNGNHRVHCPNCGHIHYRKIENGEITGDRFFDNQNSPIVDDLRPMLASCRDYQEETTEDNLQTANGFMRRLWKEKFSLRA